MRANPEEGREAHSHGTFLNGFHETWTIQHAEDAFGFAKTGQTIVNVPDAKLMKLYVDDEPLLLGSADLDAVRAGARLPHRASHARPGVAHAGRQAGPWSRSQRMVSLTHRHLAVMTFEVTLLDAAAPVVDVVAAAQPPGRRGRVPRHRRRRSARGWTRAQSRKFDHRVLVPMLQRTIASNDRARSCSATAAPTAG